MGVLGETLRAPFPWFGGKSRVSDLVWERFGDVPNYVEPFAGSLAVLLGRGCVGKNETVNDLDGFVSNFWRAVQGSPGEVAGYADWPVNENDLHGRHAWLSERRLELASRLEGDPGYYDAQIAGWWVWGLCCWIGAEFCSGKGPWSVRGGRLVKMEDGASVLRSGGVQRRRVRVGKGEVGVQRQLPRVTGAQGVHRQLPAVSTNGGQGIHRQLPELKTRGGRGVHRKFPGVGDSGRNVHGAMEPGILDWMESLCVRLRRVRVCSGDWSRVLGPSPTVKIGTTGVFLDPPYGDDADRDGELYTEDSGSVAGLVRDWALSHGDDRRYRIALCGYEGEHGMPSDWDCVAWVSGGGYGVQGDGRGRRNRGRERIWFSPGCLGAGLF